MGVKTMILSALAALAVAGASTPAQANGFESRRAGDAASSRGILLPTAETLPKGQFSVSSLELLIIGAGYGITDTTTARVLTWVPVVADQSVFGIFSVKQKVFQNDRIQLSIQPDVFYISEFGVSGGTVGLAVLGDISLDSEGKYVLTFGQNNQLPWASEDIGLLDGYVWWAHTGAQARVSERLMVQVEVFIPGGVVAGEETALALGDGGLFNYGVRITSGGVSGDLSFLMPFGVDGDGETLPMGLPFVGITGRFP